MQSQIKLLTESIYHLALCDIKDSCALCSDKLNSLIKEHNIPKHSALIIDPTTNNSRHECEPEADAIEYFSSIAYILTGDASEFTRHLGHATKITESHPSSAMFANNEDAYNWSVAKLASA